MMATDYASRQMITFFSILAVGFFLGMRHATDPDHVIAVATIVSNQRNSMRAALIGAFWGVGHTLTIFLVGTAIILFNVVIPVRLGLSMELSVAVMLIVLGLINVAAFLRPIAEVAIHKQNDQDVSPGAAANSYTHSHAHSHAGLVHSHPHAHSPDIDAPELEQRSLLQLDRAFGKVTAYRYLRPLIVGIVHGLAGSAAVALLVLTTIRDPRSAIAYLLVFGVGTIAGMMLITMGIASTFKLVAGKRQTFSRTLTVASGVLSIIFGFFVAYQICIVSGLFAAHAHWTPQ